MAGGDLAWQAVREIDSAHQELRAIERVLHVQADELMATRELLGRERSRYAEMFDAAPEAYLVTDLGGLVLQANHRTAVLFNRDVSTIVGQPLALLVASDDRATFHNLVSAMSETVLHTELRIQPHKEDLAWASVTAQRGAQHGTGPCIRWLMRSANAQKREDARRDALERAQRSRISELEASHRALSGLLEREQQARKEADERLQARERTLAEVAHELRSPLGTIAGWVHMLQHDTGEPGARKRALASMTRGVRALSRLVEELIDHARVERHQLALETREVNMVRIAIEVIEDLRPIAALKQIRIDLSSSCHNVAVHGDAWRLQQVVRNVLGNAIKFTPERGEIRIELRAAGSFGELTVVDSGRGIEPASLAAIFQPFAQVGGSLGKRSGLGLGLSIAQRIVELHGGTIDAQSEGPQRGARFRVRLPLLGASN